MNVIFELMDYFPESTISSSQWLCLSKKNNVGFTVKGTENRETIILKILEWCSRDCCKGMPYKSEARNAEWRDSLILKFNRYLGVNFEQNAWTLIYQTLGNAINQELTKKFIQSGFDLNVLLDKWDGGNNETDKRT